MILITRYLTILINR